MCPKPAPLPPVSTTSLLHAPGGSLCRSRCRSSPLLLLVLDPARPLYAAGAPGLRWKVIQIQARAESGNGGRQSWFSSIALHAVLCDERVYRNYAVFAEGPITDILEFS